MAANGPPPMPDRGGVRPRPGARAAAVDPFAELPAGGADDRYGAAGNPGQSAAGAAAPWRNEPSFGEADPELPVAWARHPNPLIDAAQPLLALVTQLRGTARHPDPAGLRDELARAVGRFEADALAAGVPREAVIAARYLLCTYIDETAAGTPWGGQGAWAADPCWSGFTTKPGVARSRSSCFRGYRRRRSGTGRCSSSSRCVSHSVSRAGTASSPMAAPRSTSSGNGFISWSGKAARTPARICRRTGRRPSSTVGAGSRRRRSGRSASLPVPPPSAVTSTTHRRWPPARMPPSPRSAAFGSARPRNACRRRPPRRRYDPGSPCCSPTKRLRACSPSATRRPAASSC